MRTFTVAAIAVSIAILSGCGSLSGFDANGDFACKAPPGVLCQSMTGIYANASQKNLPGQRVGTTKTNETRSVELSRAKEEGVLTKPIYSGTPIRSAPRVLRVWFAPWEDSDGDLHDQSYVYLPVDSGRWLIEHNRRRIQDAYRPVHAPNARPAATSDVGKGQAGSNFQAGNAQAMEAIGVVQGRNRAEDAALLGGIQQPDQMKPTP